MASRLTAQRTPLLELKRSAAADLGQLQLLRNRLRIGSTVNHDVPGQACTRRIVHGMTSCMGIDRPRNRIKGRMNLLGQPGEPAMGIAFFECGAFTNREPRALRPGPFDREIDVATRMKAWVELEDLGDRLDVIANDAERRMQTFGGQGGDTRPLRHAEFTRNSRPDALFRAEQERAREQVALNGELLKQLDQGAM